MRSLVSLLEGAAQRSASEVTLESGQPVVYLTGRGTEAETDVLPGSTLFDMIVQAVDDAQQVELAVGNPVEFAVEAGGMWTVFAEPGIEGMTVRARREGGGVSSLDIELDYEVDGQLDGGADAGIGLGVDGGKDDAGSAALVHDYADDYGGGAMLDISESGPFSLEDSDPNLAKVAVDGSDEIRVDFSSDAPPAPAAFESGTWTLDDDDDFDLGGPLPSEDSLPTGFGDPAKFDEDEDDGYGGHIGVPADDDDEEFNPFADPESQRPPRGLSEQDLRRRRTLSPTVRAMDASDQPPADPRRATTHSALPATSPALKATQQSMSALSPSEGSTVSKTRSPASVTNDTSRELERVGQGEADFAGLAADIEEGTLVYVREPGLAARLAACFRVRSVTLDEHGALDELTLSLRNAPPGTIVIVDREDPSSALGWILRRLEEGLRVFVETRARSKEGAQRMLLGVSASPRAEQWLSCHTVLALEPGEAGPQMVVL